MLLGKQRKLVHLILHGGKNTRGKPQKTVDVSMLLKVTKEFLEVMRSYRPKVRYHKYYISTFNT